MMPLKRPAVWLVITAAAVLLMLPSLVLGVLHGHDTPQAFKWAAQFAEQFRAGILYPRWLAESFDGGGAPVFYFYPPVSFWIDALVNLATGNLLPVARTLSISRLLLLVAAGLAMHAWLEGAGASRRAALVGTLAYMAAPYHMVDHYLRGSHAEFAAYAVLPLVMLAVRQVANGKVRGIAFLGVAYGVLVMTHAPLAVLVSTTALPMYVLYLGWRLGETRRAVGFFARCALAGVLGTGLAAIYLLPALTLGGWINMQELWIDYFTIKAYFFFQRALQGEIEDWLTTMALATLSYGFIAIGVLMVAARREAAFWALTGLLCALFVAGLVPWFWQLPLVDKVQFPFRLLVVTEFAVVTALCLMPWPLRSRLASLAFAAAFLAFVPSLYELARFIGIHMELTRSEGWRSRDSFEYLPAHFSKAERYPDHPLDGVPTIACMPKPALCSAQAEQFGDLGIEIDTDAPTTVTLRRFYFPAWRLEPMLPLHAVGPLRLVAFVAPPGRHVWRLTREALLVEQWGWAISGLSATLLLGSAALGTRGRRMALAP
jgi:uncharacterized membrane protein